MYIDIRYTVKDSSNTSIFRMINSDHALHFPRLISLTNVAFGALDFENPEIWSFPVWSGLGGYLKFPFISKMDPFKVVFLLKKLFAPQKRGKWWQVDEVFCSIWVVKKTTAISYVHSVRSGFEGTARFASALFSQSYCHGMIGMFDIRNASKQGQKVSTVTLKCRGFFQDP